MQDKERVMRIGVDVGGTNTDAALMDGDRVASTCKHPTTSNVSDGIVGAIKSVLQRSEVPVGDIHSVMIGTTLNPSAENSRVPGSSRWLPSMASSRFIVISLKCPHDRSDANRRIIGVAQLHR